MDMTKYISTCDRCGKQFRANLRNRMIMQREARPRVWHTDAFSRYYCDECAKLAKKALLAFEYEGGQR